MSKASRAGHWEESATHQCDRRGWGGGRGEPGRAAPPASRGVSLAAVAVPGPGRAGAGGPAGVPGVSICQTAKDVRGEQSAEPASPLLSGKVI